MCSQANSLIAGPWCATSSCLCYAGTLAALRTGMRSSTIALLALLGAAGCGGGAEPVTIRGDFADPSGAPARIRAVEGAREAEVGPRGFELRGLSPGPATLRLVRGADTTRSLAIE